MTSDHRTNSRVGLLHELIALPRETEWLEFKVNDAEPQAIGRDISALANAAALVGKPTAYVVWGVRNEDHAVVGTTFDPPATRVGNEELESWLLHLLEPSIDFRFFTVPAGERPVVLLQIARATHQPVRFSGQECIRVGTYTKNLKDFPEKERALWRIFNRTPFEDGIALERVTSDDVLHLLEYPAYFELREYPLPAHRDGILAALAGDRLIHHSAAGGWDVTNLGAILFAKRLEAFHPLRRKAVRVIQYRGTGRTEALREQEGSRGYAGGFKGLLGFIDNLLPVNEVIEQALRKTVPMFPKLAVRELVANALIHQDFFVTGAGPMIEIFDDRIEITNPGEPLVDTQRFVDVPPQSRNEGLASHMRRFRICEERGSGIDKVVSLVELFQLPAPLFEAPEGFTRAVLFAYRALKEMSTQDRLRACYLHACLRYVTQKTTTNTSVRERFGLDERNAAGVSRLLGEAVKAGLIVVADPAAGNRSRTYLPFWAKPPS